MAEPIERRVIVFHGHVQGVGFRYTAYRIAKNHSAAGCVANLPDGTVRLVIEGESAALDRYTADLTRTMSDYIDHYETEHAPATGEFSTFSIRS
jgi:acylphosphatase